MSQSFRTILGSDLISDSRGYLNDNFEAVRSAFAGATEPTSPVAYMTWYDTTGGYEKQRNAANDAWIVVGVIGQTYKGLLARSGGTMSGAIDMGGYTITNLGLGTGTAAARQQELDLKAPLAAPSLTGDATVNQDPAGVNSLIRRSWAEGRYLKLTGGTMTGALLLSSYGGGSTEAVPKQSIEDMVTFNVSTGHRHDGSNSRSVRGEDLDSTTAAAAEKLLQSTAGNICEWVTRTTVRGFTKILYGSVTALGGIDIAGSGGWTSAKVATGRYTLTFSPTLSSNPMAIVLPVDNGSLARFGMIYSRSTSVVEIRMKDYLGYLGDAGFDFMVIY